MFANVPPQILGDNEVWSSEGCWLVSEGNGSITCACNHPSTFIVASGSFVTAFLDLVSHKLLCSNADVLSPAGLKRVYSDWAWCYGPGGIFLWCSLLVNCLLVANAVRLVKNRKLHWEYRYFCTDDDAWNKEKQAEKSQHRNMRTRVHALVHKAVMKKLVGDYVSYHLHLHSDDSGLLRASTESTRASFDRSTRLTSSRLDSIQLQTRVGRAEPEHTDAGVAQLHYLASCLYNKETLGGLQRLRQKMSCLTTGTPGLFIISLLYGQPLVSMFMNGISVSSTTRVLIHTVKFYAALMVTGLFFHTDGRSMSVASEDECAKLGAYKRSLRDIVQGRKNM